MRKQDPPNTAEHPDELLLPYLEGILTGPQKTDVEKHLVECGFCASELRGLERLISALREHPAVFCPDAGEIVGFVEKGHDPDGVISRHLDSCASCSALAEACSGAASKEQLPQGLWNSIQKRLATPPDLSATQPEPARPGLLERFRSWFKIPALAAGAVAAAVLVAVLLYPRDFAGPSVGLSAITWEGVPRPKTLQPRASFVLLFRGLSEPLPQKRIDAIFRALKPDMDIAERFDSVTPAELRDAVKAGKVWIEPDSIGDTLEALHKQLNVSVAAVITVEPATGGFAVAVDLFQASTGALLKRRSASGISADALPEKIRAMVFELISS